MSEAITTDNIAGWFTGSKDSDPSKLVQFKEALAETVNPYLPAKELVVQVVRTALNVQYGGAFTKSSFSARMVDTIASTIITNPELRRQVFVMVDPILKVKADNDTKQNRGKSTATRIHIPDTN